MASTMVICWWCTPSSLDVLPGRVIVIAVNGDLTVDRPWRFLKVYSGLHTLRNASKAWGAAPRTLPPLASKAVVS